ncbi:MAG: hypothetical protein DRJ31_11330 [Candidatus Methanomethylicota archaeon]|uniref:Uncharacterized protein n=1 Tax=Thermoproteota archaeon TaxID=2056631 RepID=A0A497EL41_9CREN|nr:MAG: hypothetical protein DRJ31_11330 [Candidatus Verstraetearchaeota archaeon]
MDSKIKILVGVLVVGIVLFGGCWIRNNLSQEITQPVIQKNRVTVITDKAEYKQGEVITFTISNGLSETLYGKPTLFNYAPLVEKVVNGKWEIADAHM